MMDENKLREFLEANPDYHEVLQRAVAYEEQHANEEYFTGWIFAVRATDKQFRELVYKGIVEMGFGTGRLIEYRLADRELTKKVLRP